MLPSLVAAPASLIWQMMKEKIERPDLYVPGVQRVEIRRRIGAHSVERVMYTVTGCAIHELYEQIDGLIGDSILSYDPARKQWQQTWVTNRGSLMVIMGNFKDRALVLEGEVHLKDGKSVMQRITWKAQDKGVRESAVLSKDSGKTWTPAFDVLFLKHKDKLE